MAAAMLVGSGPGPHDYQHTADPRGVSDRVAHVFGGAVGGLVLGVVLAALTYLASTLPVIRFVTAVGIAGVALVLSRPRFTPVGGVGRHWQVPRGRRLRRVGRRQVFALWGALLGVGMLTVVPTAVALLLPAAAVAAGSPLIALLAGAVYGTARALFAVASAQSRDRQGATPGDVIDGYERILRRWLTADAFLTPAGAAAVAAFAMVGAIQGW